MWFWFDIALSLLGAVAICVGFFLIYVPAGFVMVGVALIAIAYFRRALEVALEVQTDGAS